MISCIASPSLPCIVSFFMSVAVVFVIGGVVGTLAKIVSDGGDRRGAPFIPRHISSDTLGNYRKKRAIMRLSNGDISPVDIAYMTPEQVREICDDARGKVRAVTTEEVQKEIRKRGINK